MSLKIYKCEVSGNMPNSLLLKKNGEKENYKMVEYIIPNRLQDDYLKHCHAELVSASMRFRNKFGITVFITCQRLGINCEI